MNDNKNVSIIIPTYNASKYIIQTLESVIVQSFNDYEIIIVDDCSKDDTVLKIKNYLNNINANFNLIVNEKNLGVAISRNKGISVAKGQFIAFLDSDDIWHKDKLDKQITFMRENDYAFSYTNQYSINEDNQIIRSTNKIKKVVKYKTLLKRTYISTSSVVIDINKIGKFSMPNYRRGQDYATWLILLRDVNAYGLDERLLNYRVSRGSLSSNKLDNLRQIYNIQREQEGINRIKIYINLCVYFIYAVNKTLLRR